MSVMSSLAGLSFLSQSAIVGQSEVFEHLGTADGLSHNTVTSVVEDHQGFIWLGTLDGLNRFDGRRFEVWRHDPRDPGSISSSHVVSMLQDRSGRLWAGTVDGLNRMRSRGRFERFDLVHDRHARWAGWVQVLHESGDGSVWAGTWEGLFRVPAHGEAIESFLHDPDDPVSVSAGGVIGIGEDRSGSLWVLTRIWEATSGHAVLNRLDPATGKFERTPLPESWTGAGGLLVDRSDRIWFNVSRLGVFEIGTGIFAGPLLSDPYTPILEPIVADRQGVLWISTERGFIRYDREKQRVIERIDPSAGDQLSGFALGFAEDASGSAWIATRGGVFRRDPKRKDFSSLRHRPGDPDSLSGNQVSAVLEDRRGDLWVATYGRGLNRIAAGRLRQYRHDPADPESLCHDSIWHLAAGHDRRIWLGVDDGLCSYDPERDAFTRHSIDLADGISEDLRVTFVLVEPGGELWLGSDYGLMNFEPETYRTTRFHVTDDPTGLRRPAVYSLALGPDETLWLGTNAGYLGRVDPDRERFRHYPLVDGGQRLSGEGVYQIHVDAEGGIWLATDGALSRFDPRTELYRHYFPGDGLPGSVVYSILDDDDGQLWLGTSQGLSVFDPRLPAGRQFRNYDLGDGIGSLEFNRHAVWRGSDGRFYFGGMNGLTLFHPGDIADNDYRPPVVITNARVSSASGHRDFDPALTTRLEVPYSENSLFFEFAALNYTDPLKNRYAYLLDGFDDDWVQAGRSAQARYSRVPPGAYIFRVRGSNNDGLWNLDGAALPVTIRPPYWKTWWFRTLVAILLLALLASAYRARVRHLMDMERMRWRISGDLHDEVSSDLSGIAMACDLLGRQNTLAHADREQLSAIQRTALQAVSNVRDIVWYVDPDYDRWTSLQDRFRSTARQLLPDVAVEMDFSAQLEDAPLTMDARRHLFLIFKESLNNIQRHADASSVRVTLECTAGELILTIEDDGRGLGPDATDGSGLGSMRRRAENMGGALTVSSSTAGTRVQVTLPMARIRDGGRSVVGSKVPDD